MKYNELTQYVIEANGILEVRELQIEEPKIMEHTFEPALEPKKIIQAEERLTNLEQEQDIIISVLTDIMGV